MSSKILDGMPWSLQVLVSHLICRKNMRTLQCQGTLTFSDNEIAASRQEIWGNVNAAVISAQSRSRNGDAPC